MVTLMVMDATINGDIVIWLIFFDINYVFFKNFSLNYFFFNCFLFPVLSKRIMNHHHQSSHSHIYNNQDEGDRERIRDRDRIERDKDKDKNDRGDRIDVTNVCQPLQQQQHQQQRSNKVMLVNSPIYSNQPATTSPSVFLHDTEINSHLLPLQQYILEQAKLSGNH